MTEKLHEDRQGYTGAKHFSGIGMPKLVRNDASLNAGGRGDLMERSAHVVAERIAATRAGEKKTVGDG